MITYQQFERWKQWLIEAPELEHYLDEHFSFPLNSCAAQWIARKEKLSTNRMTGYFESFQQKFGCEFGNAIAKANDDAQNHQECVVKVIEVLEKFVDPTTVPAEEPELVEAT